MNIYSKNIDLNSTVELVIEEQRKEDINRDLNATIKQMITEPSKLEVAWIFFGDGLTFYEDSAKKNLGDTDYYSLINNIEIDIKKCIKSNLDKIDFASYKDALKDINQIILDFVLNVRDNELYEIENKKPELGVGFHASHMIFLREMALVAFKNSHYSLALELHLRCKELVSVIVETDKIAPKFLEYKMSTNNKKKADNRWSKHNQTRPEKKKQYLQIMDEQNLTTFTETAEYIKQHIETDKKPSYDTIKRWLSQASQGDFS